MAMQFTTHGDIDVVTLPERLVMANAPEIRKQLQQRVNAGRKLLILDLGEASFVDSSGLSVLVSALKAVKKVGGEVVLLNLTDGVRALIELTRMHEVFEIFGDRDAAVSRLEREAA
jgi:anti-sigma B factor antagonist